MPKNHSGPVATTQWRTGSGKRSTWGRPGVGGRCSLAWHAMSSLRYDQWSAPHCTVLNLAPVLHEHPPFPNPASRSLLPVHPLLTISLAPGKAPQWCCLFFLSVRPQWSSPPNFNFVYCCCCWLWWCYAFSLSCRTAVVLKKYYHNLRKSRAVLILAYALFVKGILSY